MNLKSFLVVLALLMPMSQSAHAVGENSGNVEVRLISDYKTVSPGQEVKIGIHFELQPEWHIYWRNPGDAGLPVEVTWKSSPEIEMGELLWPFPEVMVLEHLTSYGYGREVVLMSHFTVPQSLMAGEVINVQADLKWLECKLQCIPGKAVLSKEFTVGTSSEEDSTGAAIISEEVLKVPTAENTMTSYAVQSNDLLQIIFPHAKSQQLNNSIQYFPYSDDVINHHAGAKTSWVDDSLVIQLEKFKKGTLDVDSVTGIIVINKNKSFEIVSKFDSSKNIISLASSSKGSSIGGWVFAGLILFGVAVIILRKK